MRYLLACFSLGLPAQKSCIHFAYKNCTRCLQLVYTKCIHDVYKLYPTFQQTFAYILYTKLKELLQLNFVYKMCIKVCQKVGYIFYTFCIHFLYTHSDLQKLHIIKIVYTICIQNLDRMYLKINVCKMDPMFQHILTLLICIS